MASRRPFEAYPFDLLVLVFISKQFVYNELTFCLDFGADKHSLSLARVHEDACAKHKHPKVVVDPLHVVVDRGLSQTSYFYIFSLFPAGLQLKIESPSQTRS